jgi:hypothetical protein
VPSISSRPNWLFASILAVLSGWSAASPARGDSVWIEGESLARPPAGFKVGGWGNKHYLSGGAWLYASIDGKEAEALPADGVLLQFPFEIRGQGSHEVWARVGYEFVRAPMRWRIDDGPWGDDGPERLTTDLMEIAEWTEVAWVKLGNVDLKPGKHTLQIRFERRLLPGKKQPERIIAGLDCFCITHEPFRPNGRFKPGDDWREEIDRKVEKHRFRVERNTGDTSLAGIWQIARFDEQEIKDRAEPLKELPADLGKLFWKGVQVPGNRDSARPDMLYCHRFLYRTRIDGLEKGQSYVLHFPSTALIASVFVNGKYCGGNTTPCAAWDADLTPAILPGKTNEIIVAIKDCYYALEKTGDGKSPRYMFNYPASLFYHGGGMGATRFADFPVLLQVRGAGILEAPSLHSAGPVYVADVFVKPSVSRKDLSLEITLRNSSAAAQKVRVQSSIFGLNAANTAPGSPTFAAEVVVPAWGARTVELAEKWDNLPPGTLWWPDRPTLLEANTRVFIGDDDSDFQKTVFGFREWKWSGPHFTLNGVPWHFRADLLHNGKLAPETRDKAVADWKKSGVNTVRYWGQEPWIGTSQEETLAWFDSIGMPVRRSGIFDGEAASYQLTENKNGKNVPRKALFDNWIRQLQAQVKAERNHPSIFLWSIENEITYINIRNFGLHDACEPEIRRAVRAVMDLDPTRPAMIDGGDALRDKSLPIYGNHYNEAHFRHYPDEAYTMKLAFSRHTDPWTPWPIGDDKPLFLGETFFANGFPPAAYSALSGEQAFLGRTSAQPGVTLFARMLAEGYRWHGIAGFHFWFAGELPNPPPAELPNPPPADDVKVMPGSIPPPPKASPPGFVGDGLDNTHYRAFQPVCVFCREWNWTFAPAQSVTRTLKVFNDTRFSDPIDMDWSFRVGGKVLAEGTEKFALAPGTAKEMTITLRTPKVASRTVGELVLTCRRGGKQVFRDIKPCIILAPEPARAPLSPNDLTVYDPKGSVQPWLKERGYPFRTLTSLDDLPAKLKVLIIGPDALTPRQATDPRWVALAASGARILVLDQTHPLHFQATPADLTPTDYVGRIAFPENLEHPAFAGLGKEDFFCWSDDHVVYRHAYKKASRGGRSLLQCDDELSCSALTECPVKEGVLVLSQAAIGGRLNTDPVARRLLDNLITYCLAYRLPARTTVSVFPDADLRLKLLDRAGLKHARAGGVLEAVADPRAEIVIADASPANLAKLAKAKEPLKAFTARGGDLILWGLTPEGLASFNQIVGVNHVMRPFRMERVSLPALRDPLLAGLAMRDVVLESNERIYPWAGDRYPAKDTFTHVVDLDDIAPFATSAKHSYGWSQMTNGLTSADSWKFIFYHELKTDPRPKWSADLPREEEIVRFSIIVNTHYQIISKLRLVFDDNEADAVTLSLKPVAELKQEFDIKPRRCKRITLEPIEFGDIEAPSRLKQPTTGVDNIWITVRRSDDYQKRVVPLLNIGALVKYRMGKGSILLNQVRVLDNEPNPVNGPKKQNIVATLLRNLGADFAAEKLLVAEPNLHYSPIPLNEKCTQYLTADRGWIAGQPDLGHLPIGAQKLAGVDYVIRDFKTSPLPACIMLAGPGVKGPMPKSVDGIPVDRKADVLFFLHTFHVTKEWRPQGDKKQPPTVFRYVIHYADGKTADAPVVYERGVGHWLSADPRGLPDAAVAWSGPLPKDATRQAVVYQMSWTNPRSGVAIRAIDVRYDDAIGSSYGVPIVFAITAGTAR